MKTYLITLILGILPIFSLACSCIYAGDFCSLLPNAIEQGSLVVQGSPVKTIGHGMEFKIDAVISGSTNQKRITIWGDPGYLCRTYVTGFAPKDQLLLILDPITQDRTETVTGETERKGDYSLSGCGEFFVYLNGKYKTELDCYQPVPGKPTLISVFPNPASDYFNLTLASDLSVGSIIRINVFQANGQLVYTKGQLNIQPDEPENEIKIKTKGWSKGLYFVEIQTFQDRWLTKLVVI